MVQLILMTKLFPSLYKVSKPLPSLILVDNPLSSPHFCGQANKLHVPIPMLLSISLT